MLWIILKVVSGCSLIAPLLGYDLLRRWGLFVLKSIDGEKMISKKCLYGCIIFVFVNLSLAQSAICFENISATKIMGKYSCVPNPCETDPCLPGVVWAVIDKDETYFHLTIGGQWLWVCEETSWNECTPKDGDTVIIVGEVSEHMDTRGRSYYNIEVDSLRCVARTLFGTKWDVFVIQFPICGNKCGGATISFYNKDEAIITWDNPSFEGLPFPYSEQVSLGNSIIFTISDIHETFSMSGWGVAIIDRGIKIIMSSCGPGHCGIDYILFGVPEECAEEGEMFSFVYSEYPDHCCDGLTEWDSGFDTRVSIGGDCYETGFEAGAPVGTCINCGNGSCEDIEDICNCPEDCTGGLNSDYATVDEFCSSEFWSNSMASACEEWLESEDFPVCDLCEK